MATRIADACGGHPRMFRCEPPPVTAGTYARAPMRDSRAPMRDPRGPMRDPRRGS
jgi:hypothetical protein